MNKQCVNCPGAVDHSTAECPAMRAANEVADRFAKGFFDDRMVRHVAEIIARHCARPSLPVGVPDGFLFDAEPMIATLHLIRDAYYEAFDVAYSPGSDAFRTQKSKAQQLERNLARLIRIAAAPTVKASLSAAERSISCTKPDCFPYCDCGGVDDPAPTVKPEQGTTSDQYRAELYDEVWQKARDMGYGNVTDALVELERMKQAPSLPAAGSAVEEVEVVGYMTTANKNGPMKAFNYTKLAADTQHINWARLSASISTEPLMTVAQCLRMLDQQCATISAQQSAPERVSVPVEWCDAVKELFDARQAKDDFERENPGNSTKRWDACLQRIEDAEDGLRALLASHAQAPHSNGVEPNELREAVKRFRDDNASHGRGEANG